ncbi:DNA-directed RNA polymerase subunit beta [Paenibacillus spiritus]|uniref:DNA-directed RNA polymerase subunit beta n=1 Tax=Paenibacillus spiritus TaxID=2496557 RepID=A0A5J5FW14_9BACL|nr:MULTISPECIES: DNA-directed RNA polymerase subunit beta [Paenibacillus]KAA8998008.1 DNA-directed RNA polymerase subunit beta [Paenibacillus spiritus]
MSRQAEEQVKDGEPPQKRRKRSAWKIIQWFLIPLLLIAALGGGLVTGYVVMGKKEIADVFQWSTWRHVYDLVFAS